MPKKSEKTKTSKTAKPAKAAKAKAPKLQAKAKSGGKVAKAVKAIKDTFKKVTTTPAPKAAKKVAEKAPKVAAKVEIQAVAKSTKSVVSVKGGKMKVTETEIIAVAVQETAKGKKKGGKEQSASGTTRKTSLMNGCREMACESLPTSAGYCRAHYIKNWKKIKRKEAVLKDGKLNQYVEELVFKYPEKYIEAIRHDLANDKEFMKVIRDLELDEAIDDVNGEDGEAPEAVAVEGVGSGRRGADLDDDGDLF